MSTSDSGPDRPDAEVRFSTIHVDVAPLSDDPLCAGTLALMDDHVEHLLNTLELHLDERITVYLFSGGDESLADWCPPGAAGCADGTTVYARVETIAHELVHAVASSLGRSWWEEGTAEAFVASSRLGLFEGDWHPKWGSSPHLNRWLVDRFGAERYKALYRQTRYHAEQAVVEATARNVLGREFAEVLDEYAATAPYIYPARWECHVSPGAAEPTWQAGIWDHEASVDCDDSATFSSVVPLIGPRMTLRVPVSIPEDGRYWFVADHPEADLAMQPCPLNAVQEPWPDDDAWPIELLGDVSSSFLRAGPHVLLVHVPYGPATTVRIVGYPALAPVDTP